MTLEIVSLVLNLILGTGFIVSMVTLKQQKRKATTDVEKGNVELVTSSVNEMLQSVNALMGQNKDLVKEIVNRNDENGELKKKMDHLTRRVDKMQKAIKDVLIALEKLDIDESVLKPLKDEIKNPC